MSLFFLVLVDNTATEKEGWFYTYYSETRAVRGSVSLSISVEARSEVAQTSLSECSCFSSGLYPL